MKFKYNFVVSDVGSLLASFIINYECTVSVQQAVEAGFQFMKCGSVITFDLNLNCSKNSGGKGLKYRVLSIYCFFLVLQRVHTLPFSFPAPHTELPHHHSF